MEFETQVDYLLKWLEGNAPGSALMWCHDDGNKKNPKFKHSDGNWTNKKFLQAKKQGKSSKRISILTGDLVVFDFDNQDAYNKMYELFPNDFNINKTINESTTKGSHWYFKRPTIFDQEDIFTKINIDSKVDMITIYSSGTRGNIVCAPSSGKNWELAPWDGKLREPTEELINWVLERIDKKQNYDESYIQCVQAEKSETSLADISWALSVLSRERCDNYEYWRNIGWAIAYGTVKNKCEICETNGCCAFNLFDEWSSTSEKYNAGSVIKCWNECNLDSNSSIKLGTLFNYAKEDAPEEFENKFSYKLKKLLPRIEVESPIVYDTDSEQSDTNVIIMTEKDIDIFDKSILDFTEINLGNVFHKYNKNNYVYTAKTLGWLRFNKYNKMWEKIPEEFIMGDVHKFFRYPLVMGFKNTLSAIIDKKQLNEDGYATSKKTGELLSDKDKEYKEAEKQKSKYLDKVGSGNFVSNIIKSMRAKFYNEDTSIFDNKPELFAFNDGYCYNFKLRKYVNIKYDDYLTINCGYPRPGKFDIPQEALDKVIEVVKSIAGDQGNYQKLLELLSLSLYGLNTNQVISFFTGEGSNGKSALMRFVGKVFGNYSCYPDAALITSYMEGNSNPARLAQTYGKRFLCMSEPEQKEGGTSNIKADTVKKITGCESVQCRKLYGDPINFIPAFTPIMCCNDLPTVSNFDNAYRRRQKILKFPNTFLPPDVYNKKRDQGILNDNEFCIDYQLFPQLENDHTYKYAFLLLLIETYNNMDGKFVETDEMKENTNEYACENNPSAKWFLDNYTVIMTPEPQTFASDIYNNYKRSVPTHERVNEKVFYQKITLVCVKKSVGKPAKVKYFCIPKDVVPTTNSESAPSSFLPPM